jgi:hypothetical protein
MYQVQLIVSRDYNLNVYNQHYQNNNNYDSNNHNHNNSNNIYTDYDNDDDGFFVKLLSKEANYLNLLIFSVSKFLCHALRQRPTCLCW